jgi:hypothetical protein
VDYALDLASLVDLADGAPIWMNAGQQQIALDSGAAGVDRCPIGCRADTAADDFEDAVDDRVVETYAANNAGLAFPERYKEKSALNGDVAHR